MIKQTGKSINLRLAALSDAEFILALRTQTDKTRHLNPVENNLKNQQQWLKAYQLRQQAGLEYYFIIESQQHEPLGLVRVYDLQPESFCWGSWLIKDGAPQTTAIQSALLIYEFGFQQLGYKKAHFDVRKANQRVIAFHQRFGARIIGEDALNYYFNYTYEDYLTIKQKYRRFLN
ncbi:GNAT family N-acetyltransferase [Thiomicrospira microaerophila]|uniref:GNAT family N-acetyltransferase n=1 Tax=Thiomicrospira microaerophila TaxID=406020 RepID=UPI00200C63C8|nr:GNAT family N-acetyltransferase [Thiomicrospira microaerophila]UQB42409.1 GNAT family N-acetyltransferase [Thiomicrospira microaerophila]